MQPWTGQSEAAEGVNQRETHALLRWSGKRKVTLERAWKGCLAFERGQRAPPLMQEHVSLPCFTIDLATAAVSFLSSQSSYPNIGCAIHQKAIVYMLQIISCLIVWYIMFLILEAAVAKTCVLWSGEAAPKIVYWQPVVQNPAVLPSWIPRFKIHFSV
jgi:hypothetical protein